jgi:hypothetical protein
MPPSVNKLTPLEKRLRRMSRFDAIGHNVIAANCFWGRLDEVKSDAQECAPCAKIRQKYPALNRTKG